MHLLRNTHTLSISHQKWQNLSYCVLLICSETLKYLRAFILPYHVSYYQLFSVQEHISIFNQLKNFLIIWWDSSFSEFFSFLNLSELSSVIWNFWFWFTCDFFEFSAVRIETWKMFETQWDLWFLFVNDFFSFLIVRVKVSEVIFLLKIDDFVTALLSLLSFLNDCEISKLFCEFWFESCRLVFIIEISSSDWSELFYHAVHKVNISLTSSMMCTFINELVSWCSANITVSINLNFILLSSRWYHLFFTVHTIWCSSVQ